MAAAPSSPPTGVSLAPFAKLPTGEEPSNAVQELTRRAKEAADLFKKTGSFTPKPAGPAPEDFAPPGAVPVDEVSPDSFAPKAAMPIAPEDLVTNDPAHPLSKPVEALAKDASFDPLEFYKSNAGKLTTAEERKLAEVYSARTDSSPDKLGMIGEFAKGTVRALPAVWEMGKTIAKEAWRQAGAVPEAAIELVQGRPQAALKEISTQAAGLESGSQQAADLFLSTSRNLGNLVRRVSGNKMSVEDAQLLLDTEAGMAKMRSDTVEGKGPLTGHVIDAMHTAAQGYGEDFKINPENVKAAAEVLNPLWVVGMGGAGKVAGAAKQAGKFAAVDSAGRVVAEAATKEGAEAAVKTYTTAAGDWLKSWGAAQEGKAAPAIFGSRGSGGVIGAGIGSMIGGPMGGVVGALAGGILSPIARTSAAKLAEGAGGLLARAGETLPFRAAEAIAGATASGAAHAAKPWGSTANVLFGTAGISELLGGSPEKAGELFGGALSFGGGLGAAGATAGVAREALHTAASRVVSAAYTPPKDFVGVEQPQTYGEKEFASEPALDASTAEYVANRGDAAANRFEYLRQKLYNLLGLKIFVAPTAEAYVNAVGELGSKADPTQPGYFNFDKKTIVLNQNTLAAGHEIGHVFDSILSKVEDGALIHKYNQGLLDAHGEEFVASKGKMYLEALGVNTEGMTKDRFIEAGLDELRPEMISNLLRGAPLGAQKSPMLRWVNLWLAGVAEKTGLYSPQEGRGPASQSDVYGWGSSPLADRTVRQHVEQLLGLGDKAGPRPPRLWPEETPPAASPTPAEGTLTVPPSELQGETAPYVAPPPPKPVGPETARLLKEYGFTDADLAGMTPEEAAGHLDRLKQTGVPTQAERQSRPVERIPASEVNPPEEPQPEPIRSWEEHIDRIAAENKTKLPKTKKEPQAAPEPIKVEPQPAPEPTLVPEEGLQVEPAPEPVPEPKSLSIEEFQREQAAKRASTDIHAAEPPGTQGVLEAPSNVAAPKRVVPNADEVRKLAPEESKADVEVASKAAQDGNAMVLQYGSVKTEGTPGAQHGETRRAEQADAYAKEALGAMDSETRTWVDKAVIPTGWLIRKGNNINLQTFSISAMVGNAQHLIGLLEKAGLLDRIPAEYGYSPSTRSFRPSGWKTFVSDLRIYLENHSHGFGGDGTPLKKPPGWSGEWQKPTEGYIPKTLSTAAREFLNASMGNTITPPKTARSQGPEKALIDYPAVGATKTAQMAGLQVTPRGMYVHPETKATAMYGEPNALRQTLFEKGVDLGKELVSVNAELNLEHIRNAQDGGPIGRFNTQFGRSGFAVSPDKMASVPMSETTKGSIEKATELTGRPVQLIKKDIRYDGKPGLDIRLQFKDGMGSREIASVVVKFQPSNGKKSAYVIHSYAIPDFRGKGPYASAKVGHGVYAELATELQKRKIEYLTGDIVGLGAMGLRGKMFGDPVKAYVSEASDGRKHKEGDEFFTTADALQALLEETPEYRRGLKEGEKPSTSDIAIWTKHYVHPEAKYAVDPQNLDVRPKTGKGLSVRSLAETAGNTAIVRSKPSTVVTHLLDELKGGRTLHQGAGQPGNPDRALLDSITETVHYDPNHSPETADMLNKGDFDKVITPFVVNVLPPDMRGIVYETAAKSVKPGGKVYIAARGTQYVPVEGKPGWKSSGDGWLVKNKGEINFQRGYTPEQLKAEAEQYFKEVKILRKGSAPIIEASKPILKGTK